MTCLSKEWANKEVLEKLNIFVSWVKLTCVICLLFNCWWSYLNWSNWALLIVNLWSNFRFWGHFTPFLLMILLSNFCYISWFQLLPLKWVSRIADANLWWTWCANGSLSIDFESRTRDNKSQRASLRETYRSQGSIQKMARNEPLKSQKFLNSYISF